MTITQIRYFLTAARTLNFTKAAQQLYISQPALSKQIVSIERELNAMLFVREDNAVRLTPAGAMLAQEMEGFLQRYDQIVAQVRAANEGFSGTLRITTLAGQWLGPVISLCLQTFTQRHPGIALQMTQAGFREMRGMLERGETDLVLTMADDVSRDAALLWQPAGSAKAALALSVLLPAAQRDTLAAEELYNEPCLLLDPQESAGVSSQMRLSLRQLGLGQNTRLAPDLPTMAQWIEAGLGVGLINELSPLAANPNVRLLRDPALPPVPLGWAWRQDNCNPAIALLLGCMRK